jgi:hypothetical protein
MGTIIKDEMAANTQDLTWENVDLDNTAQVQELEDRLFQEAKEGLHRELRRMQDLGIIDEHGNRLSKELPADMQEGSDRDFGG